MKCPLCDAEHEDIRGWRITDGGPWPHLIRHLEPLTDTGVRWMRCWCGVNLVDMGHSHVYGDALYAHLEANGGILQHYTDCLMGVQDYA